MRAALCLLCLCGCALVAGCGTRGETTSSSSSSSSSSLVPAPAGSRPELIKQLEGGCLDLNGVLQTIASGSPNPADAFYDAYSEGVTRMRAGVPPRYLAGLRDFLRAGHALAGSYESVGEAVESGDRSLRTKTMQDAAVAKAHFARAAADQGIRYCGQGPDPLAAETTGAEEPDSRP
jgi:hypothetical protein